MQSATSHDLGQNFARAYDIRFADADQEVKYAYTTSWGMSWRMLGGMIMTHGDDRGLRVPPKMAPMEAVFVPIVRSSDERAVSVCREAAAELAKAGFRVRVDARDQQPGWKYSEWDLRGVPVRIEHRSARRQRRECRPGAARPRKRRSCAKSSVRLEELAPALRATLDDVQRSLYEQAKAFLRAHTVRPPSRGEFYAACTERAGMIEIAWCGLADCEAHVKAGTGATTRNLRPLEAEARGGCVACGEPAKVSAYFAQSY